MNCPHCQRPLPDPNVATCPFCGMPVHSAAGQDPYANPTAMQSTPGEDPTRPAWNQPPGSEPSLPAWNQPAQPAQPAQPVPPAQVELPGQFPPPSESPPPGYTPSTFAQPPTPAYGQPAYGQQVQPPTPGYGQPQQPAYGQPTYGQPAQPMQPMQPNYQAAYPQTPAQPWPGQTQAQPQKKSRAGCVIGCLVALVLVVGLVGGGAYFLKNQPGGITLGGATIGGSSTGPGGGSIIYQDALDGSTKSSWTNDSNCFFGSGGYHINAGFICYAPADTVGDGVTTVSVKEISGPITYFYGLVVRRASKGNYYEYEIDANGKWRFGKVVNGTSTDIVKFTQNAAIKKGLNQVNMLSVQAKGSHFVLFVNGTQVGTADDSTFTSGETGLSGNDGIEVVFTSLSIAHVK